MLVLTRKAGERIAIADDVLIEILAVRGNQIRIGIQAPPEMTILRAELVERQRSRARPQRGPTRQPSP